MSGVFNGAMSGLFHMPFLAPRYPLGLTLVEYTLGKTLIWHAA